MEGLEQVAFGDKPSRELLVKVGAIGMFYEGLSTQLHSTAEAEHEENPEQAIAMLLLATLLLEKAVSLFDGLPNPENATIGDCYSLLFKAEDAEPFVVEIVNTLEENGIHVRNDDDKNPAEVYRQLLML